MTRVVFMGTPRFGELVLSRLLEAYEVVGVVTRPDRRVGRGQSTAISPVKRLAQSHNLPILQPTRLRSEASIQLLRDRTPQLIVVAAFGAILPQPILDLPQCGCINVHASLLPRHRGAAPIPAAILAGDQVAGITIMLMEAGLDTGPILSQGSLSIEPEDTTRSLTEKLGVLGSQLLIATLPSWLAGQLKPIPQDDSQATYAGMIRHEDGHIQWSEPAEKIARRCRAYDPWPGTFTFWQGQLLKLISVEAVPSMAAPAPVGSVLATEEAIAVVTGQGLLVMNEIQLAGKKRMAAHTFARGQRGFVGSVLC